MTQNSKIAVVGYGVVPPTPQTDDAAPGLRVEVLPLARRHKRFACRAGEHAITACRLAFDMAGIEPESVGERFGFYVNQAGHQHGDIDDFQLAFMHRQEEEHAIAHLWNNKRVHPFLAIKGLSNNILGVISVLWSFRGDCCAFVRDHAGAASALDEAMFNLRHGYIDTALVLTAGTHMDDFEHVALQLDAEPLMRAEIDATEFNYECGAVALVLRREHLLGAQHMVELDNLTHEYSMDKSSAPDLFAQALTANTSDSIQLQSILQAQHYRDGSEPRWGGILFSVASIIHALRDSDQEKSIRIHSRTDDGLNISVGLSVLSGETACA